MKRFLVLCGIVALAGWVFSATFTDVDTAKYHGKTGLKDLTETLDANFTLIESGGTISMVVSNLQVNGTLLVTNAQATTLRGTLGVTGASTLTGAVTASTNTTVYGPFLVTNSQPTTLRGTLTVTGASTLTGAVAASTNVTVSGSLLVTNTQATVLDGTLTVRGGITGTGAGITALSAANLTAGTIAPAVDGNAITNLAAANLTGALPAVDGSALTGLPDETNTFADLTIATTALSDTQATVTVTCKDLNGDTLARAKAFPVWWSTYAVSTVATTNGVEQFTLTKGSIRRYDYNASSEVNAYLGESDADGTFVMTATCDTGPWTNRIHAVSANGSYTNLPIVFQAP